MRPARSVSWLTKGLLGFVVLAEILALVIGVASPAEAKIQFGTYTGTGATTTVTTLFAPDIVWVLAVDDLATGQTWWTSLSVASGSAVPFASASVAASLITLSGTGFQTINDANTLSKTYQWVAFTSEDTAIAYGTYTGDGTNPRTITVGTGWQPDFYHIIGNNLGRFVTRSMQPGGGVFREMSLANGGTMLGNTCGAGLALSKAVSTGITLCDGGTNSLNRSSQTYYWIALKENHSKGIWWGTYNGDGLDGHSVSVTSQSPSLALCVDTNWDGSNPRKPQWRTAANAANTSKALAANATDQSSTTGLKSFSSTAFVLGTSTVQCNSGDLHDAMALQPNYGQGCLLAHCRFRVVKP